MYKLLEKYDYRSFMEGEGGGNGGGGASGDGGAGGAGGGAGDTGGVAGGATGDNQPGPGAGDGTTALDKAIAAAAGGDGKPPAQQQQQEPPKPDDKAAAWKEYEDDPNKTPEENAAAKAEHDKTKPNADAIDPASYKIDPPEGFEVDESVMGEFRTLAAGEKWTQEQVDKLKGLQIKLYEKQAAAQAAMSTKWGEEIVADKELGGPEHDAKMGKAGAFLQEFFDPKAIAVLNAYGLGNHPELIRGFYRAGVAMGEAGTIGGRKAVNKTESVADILYGS